MVGAGLQLVNVYFMKRDIAWIAFGTAAGGFVAAYLAAGPYHPHAHELSEHRQSGVGPARPVGRVDPWAGGIGAVLQGANLFFLQVRDGL